jgi:hypothetical protein
VQRIALRGWDAKWVDEEDWAEQKRAQYVLRQGVPGLMMAMLRACLVSPGRFILALWLAVKLGRRIDTEAAALPGSMYRWSVTCMTALSTILGTLAALILVPVLLVQVLMALPAYRPRPLPQSRCFLAGILIPDNDEAAVIAPARGSIFPQIAEGNRLLTSVCFFVGPEEMSERACQKLNAEGGSALALYEEPR